jgi:hypothetical protein
MTPPPEIRRLTESVVILHTRTDCLSVHRLQPAYGAPYGAAPAYGGYAAPAPGYGGYGGYPGGGDPYAAQQQGYGQQGYGAQPAAGGALAI